MRYLANLLLIFCAVAVQPPLNAQFIFNVKRTFTETGHQIIYAGFTSDGKYIVTTGSDNNIIIWNAETGIIYRTLAGVKKRPNAAVYSTQKNVLISGGDDNAVTIWDPVLLKITSTLTGHQGPVKSLDISPDGRYIASGSADATIRIWNLNSGNLVYELKGHKKDINSLQFSPDGEKLVSGSADQTIILWNLANGNIINTVKAHDSWVSCVRFSDDGSSVASCGYDKLIKIWSVPGLSCISTLKGHRAWVQTADFTPDGKNLVSGGHDQLIILWDVASGKILYQSEKQGQIVLSVDISPTQPDLISATVLSEELKKWALSGLETAQWEVKPAFEIPTTEVAKNNTGDQKVTLDEQAQQGKEEFSTIEIFSPSLIDNGIIHNQADITLIGRVIDPDGVNNFLINNKSIRLSDAGVFQYNLDLTKGENPVDLVAINNNGKMTQRRIMINCTAVNAVAEKPEIPAIQKGKYYALLIGVNNYQDEGINDLDNPVADAEALYNVLSARYTFDKENIIFLKDPELDEMILAFDQLSNRLTMDDNLLIFYAGHGHWDDKGNVGYWLPSDATSFSTVKWFRNSTLRDFIGSIQAKHTVLIADACFSGAIFKTRAAFTEPSQGIQKLYELPSRKAMTSGILQEVPDESVFIKYLIKRLQENEDKFLSSEVLFSSFKTAVMNNSPNVPQFGTIQNVGDEGGDFIFIVR